MAAALKAAAATAEGPAPAVRSGGKITAGPTQASGATTTGLAR